MDHLLLLVVCILSIEVFIRLGFLSNIDSILKVTKKVIYIIPQNNISDHWKEKVIPVYALRIMKYSLKMLFILFLISSLFFLANFLFDNFIAFALSLFGIFESIIFAFGYFYIKSLTR